MKLFKSLSAKIIAAVFALVAIAFIADTLLTQSISRRAYESTEALASQMRNIVEEKDHKIQALLAGLLESKESTHQLEHTLAASELNAQAQRKEALLEGTRHGVSMSVASLVSSAMMSGDAEAAIDQIDTLLENDQIAAINLWRDTGELAFRDNKTIRAVNVYTETDTFDDRDLEPAISIPADRKAVLQKALSKNSNHESLDAELKDEMVRPFR